MSSRKELKEQRKREREEAERRAQQHEHRRRRLRTIAMVAGAAAVVGVFAAFALLGGGDDDPKDAFAANPEQLDERLAKSKLAPGSDHIHPTVRVVANGEPISIPGNIGVGTDGQAHAPIHVHPPDEQLHAEGVEEGRFTLGQFMTVWGVALTSSRLGPYRADARRKVLVLAKPKGQAGYREVREPATLKLRDGDEVYVLYGTREQSPITL